MKTKQDVLKLIIGWGFGIGLLFYYGVKTNHQMTTPYSYRYNPTIYTNRMTNHSNNPSTLTTESSSSNVSKKKKINHSSSKKVSRSSKRTSRR